MSRGKGEVTKLRERILERRGLKKAYRRGLTDETVEPRRVKDREGKTILMYILERLHGADIDRLLDMTKPIKTVADNLEIDESTVSKWRLRRGLRDTVEQEYVL